MDALQVDAATSYTGSPPLVERATVLTPRDAHTFPITLAMSVLDAATPIL
ncbi:hypothetical protein IWX62_001224 [Arthrobacter sp. CAN_A1]